MVVLSCLNGSNFLSLYFQNCHMAGKKLKTLTMEHTTLSKFSFNYYVNLILRYIAFLTDVKMKNCNIYLNFAQNLDSGYSFKELSH